MAGCAAPTRTRRSSSSWPRRQRTSTSRTRCVPPSVRARRAALTAHLQRIIDNVPRIIDYDFLRAIAREIQGALIVGLGVGAESAAERARAYLAEDEGVTSQRAALEQKRMRLETVQNRLYNFGT